MKPALRSKLTLVIRNFMDRLFAKIPLEEWININQFKLQLILYRLSLKQL